MPVAESLGLAVLGWVLSPVVKDLISKGTSYLGTDIGEGLEDLETTLLPQLGLVLRAAENNPHKDELLKWLTRLKNAYYDAEAILHDLEYEGLKRKAKSQNKKRLVKLISSHLVIQSLAKFTGKVSINVSMLSPEKRELCRRLNKLKQIAAEAKTFHELLKIPIGNSNETKIVSSRRVTSSLLPNEVFGLDGHRDDIISFLLHEQGGSSLTIFYSVVAITGIGGAGKTTLAQYVYNHEKVKKHFESKMMWLFASENKTIEERTKEMIECLTGEHPNLNNFNELHIKLKTALQKSEHVLVVLDDVWYDERAGEKPWEDLLAPFLLKGGKCKIVVTSRSKSLPIALQPGKLIELGDMVPDDFVSLFRHHAIAGLNLNNPQLEQDLSDIAVLIGNKMSRSPLVAKVVGHQLRKQPNKMFWKATQQNVDLRSTREVLLWSYQCMDTQLQRCFLYFGIFPRETLHGKGIMAHWVALDFIHSSDDKKTDDDIGLEYFQMMLDNSILQLVNGHYVMHDLFHDLAENLSAQDCFRVTNFEREIPPTTLYLYLKVSSEMLKENKSSMGNLRNLRALIVHIPFKTDNDVNELLSMVSTNFKNLRVLDVWSAGYKTLPAVVGDLRNLRSLKVCQSSIEKLPDSVSRLYHLQFLILPKSIIELPTRLSDLIKLRSIQKYDDIYSTHVWYSPLLPFVGKLISLQYLHEFHVRKEEGYELSQLGSLRNITGPLKIFNLENVKQKDEALNAKLANKINLKRLELVWDESVDQIVSDLEVIEALQPPPNLEELLIDGYRNSRYPAWLGEGSQVLNLEFLDFSNCESLTILPPILSESHNCHQLSLRNLGALRELGNLPECLRELHINKCPCLIFMCADELQIKDNPIKLEAEISRPSMMQFNEFISKFYTYHKHVLCFEEVKIFKQIKTCSELLWIFEDSSLDHEEPEHWENLMRAWWNCHQHRMNFIFTSSRANRLKLPTNLCILNVSYCCVSDGALSDCLSGMAALEELSLEGIMTITTLPPEVVMQSMQSLRVLKIKHCWCLRSLGGVHALAKLEKFKVKLCWGLEMECDYTRLPPALKSFSMHGCVVPQGILLGDLPCLQEVKIHHCQVSETISFGQLISLKILELIGCPHLSAVEGFKSRPFIEVLFLALLPRLDVESILKSWKGCRNLIISSSEMLDKLLTAEEFAPPEELTMYQHKDDDITFEKSDSLQSIFSLRFGYCETRNLPKTLYDFSTLEFFSIKNCENISELPELPGSVQYIKITGCPLLQERCQQNGPEWHKIKHIPDIDID